VPVHMQLRVGGPGEAIGPMVEVLAGRMEGQAPNKEVQGWRACGCCTKGGQHGEMVGEQAGARRCTEWHR
jgi:hypothetical protein